MIELKIKAKKLPCRNKSKIVSSMDTQEPICEVKGTIRAKKQRKGRRLRLAIKALVKSIVGSTNVLLSEILLMRASV